MSVLAVAALPVAVELPGAVVSELLRVPAAVGTRVLVAAGSAGVVHDRAVVAAPARAAATGGAAAGGGDERVELPVDTQLLAGLAGRSGFSRGRTDLLGGDLARLIGWCAEQDPARTVLPVEIPADAGAATLEAVAAGVRGAAADQGRDVAVTAIGDYLPATGAEAGRGGDPAAAAWERRAVAALRARDTGALAALGPREARSVGARGWAPATLVALLAELGALEDSAVRLALPDAGGELGLGP